MAAPSPVLRPLVPVVAVALLGTALLAAWIRVGPLPMPPIIQVALSVGVVLVVAVVLALVRRREREVRDAGYSRPADPTLRVLEIAAGS